MSYKTQMEAARQGIITKEMQTACTDFSSQLQDADLKAFTAELSNRFQDCFTKFYSLL